jgi:hypothetical protein
VGSPSTLYNQYSAGQKHPAVFSQTFGAGSILVSLRPFYIPDDFQLYNKWINEEIKKEKNEKQIPSFFSETYFRIILESSNAQSLWGTINDQPAFQADFYKAVQYHTAEQLSGMVLSPGDVMFQLVIAPEIQNENHFASFILPACLQYLAINSERAFLTVSRSSGRYNKLAQLAGPVAKMQAESNKFIYVFRLDRL